ncbi:phosphatidate cytidylyltransferase [Echinimonas agarilytica]|uniref:Phosphatidate cytidylyltransferase n=1 Tax=Echinimonas agarilytica TaxID=1215918 RepID=A0AA41W520_9GAMM|nr:phosphatidate cytidylyltransferase [Echinimonas agarilytica]MCM2679129.1 phosphatidate cytidylyltransferase [Echinimonas agarilytica]
MLKLRIITALVLLPLALSGLFLLPDLGFEIAIAGIVLICAWEWGTLMGGIKRRLRTLYGVISVAIVGVVMASSLAGQHWIEQDLHPWFDFSLWLALCWWVVAGVLVACYPKAAGIWQSWPMKALIGWLTLIPWGLSMVALRSIPSEQSNAGPLMLLMALMLVWAADTGGYIFGRKFGKTKLMPKVSPGKTVEGMLGGVFLATLIVVGGLWYFPAARENLVVYLLFCYLTVIAGVLGDLVESMLKRDAGVKDSGKILPGHGGILDRVDSLTAAVPIFALGALYWAV